MIRRLALFAVALVAIGCGADVDNRICLRQTCEERYYTQLVLIGKVWMPQRRVRTVCECHEYYVPGEPKPEQAQ